MDPAASRRSAHVFSLHTRTVLAGKDAQRHAKRVLALSARFRFNYRVGRLRREQLAQAISMPQKKRQGELDDLQRRAPLRPYAGEPDPEKAISVVQG
jgi:hypothetical protein